MKKRIILYISICFLTALYIKLLDIYGISLPKGDITSIDYINYVLFQDHEENIQIIDDNFNFKTIGYTKTYDLKPINLVMYTISIHSKNKIPLGVKFKGKFKLTFMYKDDVIFLKEVSKGSNIKSS